MGAMPALPAKEPGDLGFSFAPLRQPAVGVVRSVVIRVPATAGFPPKRRPNEKNQRNQRQKPEDEHYLTDARGRVLPKSPQASVVIGH
jgi:hypothetical protein